jgi:hypothetical protein
MNDTIFVKDLKVSDKVEILDDPEQAIVTVLTITEEVVEEAPVVAPAEGAAAPAEGAAAPADEKKE